MVILLRIKGPNFVAGLEFDKNTKTVVRTAPILNWAMDKNVQKVFNWCRNKRFECLNLGEGNDNTNNMDNLGNNLHSRSLQ